MEGVGSVFHGERETWISCWMGPLEAAIMDAVWSGSAKRTWTIRQLTSAVRDRGMPGEEEANQRALTTIATTVKRLVEKGLLALAPPFDDSWGRKHLVAGISEQDFYREVMQRVLVRFHDEQAPLFRKLISDL